jgi:hypothetical protein
MLALSLFAHVYVLSLHGQTGVTIVYLWLSYHGADAHAVTDEPSTYKSLGMTQNLQVRTKYRTETRCCQTSGAVPICEPQIKHGRCCDGSQDAQGAEARARARTPTRRLSQVSVLHNRVTS